MARRGGISAEHGFGSFERSAEHGFTPFRRSAQNGFTPIRRSAQNGFTLIEMMVALVVFGLAAMALIRLEGATIRTTATLDATAVAQMVARNVAVEAMTDARMPAPGVTSGLDNNGGRAWHWTRMVAPLGDQGAMRITVDVGDAGGTALGHLAVVRTPPPIVSPAKQP